MQTTVHSGCVLKISSIILIHWIYAESEIGMKLESEEGLSDFKTQQTHYQKPYSQNGFIL